MEVIEILDIMNSDFKLWEAAEDEDVGPGKVNKTINLPWGIGEVTVTREGMNDAGKRRAAVGAYGEHIRGLIRDRTSDESVEARAKQAAARAELANSEDSDGVGGVEPVHGGPEAEEEVQEEVTEEAARPYGPAAEQSLGLRETLTLRRAEVDDRIGILTVELDTACRELRGIDAALAAMEDDPADS